MRSVSPVDSTYLRFSIGPKKHGGSEVGLSTDRRNYY